jgi:hypothetical protein
LVVEGQVDALENDFLICAAGILVHLEGDTEVVHGALDSEVLTAATVDYLAVTRYFHVVTFNSNELALIKRQFIVELVLLAILRFKRYFKAFDICIAEVEGAEIDILEDLEDVLVTLVEHVSDELTVEANTQGILDEGACLHTHSQEG